MAITWRTVVYRTTYDFAPPSLRFDTPDRPSYTAPRHEFPSSKVPMKHSLIVLLIAASTILAGAQDRQVRQPTLTPQNSGTTQSLIAVSPVNARVVWASGRGGTYVVTTDGGKTWKAGVVPGAENLQFRDVQGVSEKVAYLLSIGNEPTAFRILQDGRWGSDLDNRVRERKSRCFLRLLWLLDA